MVKERRKIDEIDSQHANVGGESGIYLEMRKISRILALTSIKGLPQNQQIAFLNSSGFSPTDISEMVGTTKGVVHQTLYENRKVRKGKPSKKSKVDSKK